MKYFLIAAAVTLGASPALAGANIPVPEMDAGFGLTAFAIVAGVAAIVREKFFRK